MTMLLFAEVLVFLILYILSKDKFEAERAFAKDKGDKLSPLIPIGFQLMALLKHKYGSLYEKRLESKLGELEGMRYAHDSLRHHVARKSVILMLALMFVSFVGTQIEVDMSYAVFAVTVLLALFYLTDKQIEDRIKSRRREIQIEFPEFLNKLILLVNAGLTVSGAIQKILRDNRKDSALYTELGFALNEIDSGKPELYAYEEFAKRCRLQEITMFVSILIQNLRKGNSELIPILRLQANTCWENRKNIARKLGEEASTKLLFPMIIVFIAILIMIMAPAVFQLQL